MTENVLQKARNLLQAGQAREAAILYHQILRANPRHSDALCELGVIYLQMGQFQSAEGLFSEALKLDPPAAEVHCVHGIALVKLGRTREALQSFDQALALKPALTEALFNRASALLGIHRVDEAIAGLTVVLALNPDHAVSWHTLGNAFAQKGQFEKALESYDKALAIMPGFTETTDSRNLISGRLEAFRNELSAVDADLFARPQDAARWCDRGRLLSSMKRFAEAKESYDKALALNPDLADAVLNHAIALVELGGLARCPPAYLSALFDQTAPQYDELMLRKLDYRGVRLLRSLAQKVLPRPVLAAWRMLDLGCGTGLVGQAFADMKTGGRLDGIDISPRMIEVARQRGIYDSLILGDLETVLAEPGPHYNLVLAADTMIFFGDLEPSLTGVGNRLDTDGFYLFTVESKQGEGWDLQSTTHRFRHSESHLREIAARIGYRIVEIDTCILRNENTFPVEGLAVALQKLKLS